MEIRQGLLDMWEHLLLTRVQFAVMTQKSQRAVTFSESMEIRQEIDGFISKCDLYSVTKSGN